jgi:hypothetical protein
MTGIRGEVLPDQAVLEINESEFPYARTFGDVKPGDGFWYRNANGLVEVAANRRKAAEKYCLYVGATVLAC